MKFFPKTRAGKIRLAALLIVASLAALIWVVRPLAGYFLYEPMEGDIIFQALPKGDLVEAIEGVSNSSYSHCGVVVRDDGGWAVNESIGKVGSTSLFYWVVRGRGAGFAVYRLKEEHHDAIPAFIRALRPYQGKDYDFQYRMDDRYIYCSELVFKAFRDATGLEMGTLEKLGDLNWKPYEKTIRLYEQGPPPLERLMITPKSLSQSPLLEKIYNYNFE